jgi:CheY-like chemotaxis protein
VTLPAQPVHLDADPTRLTQIIGNLLNNAWKFTNDNGHVSVSVEVAGQQAVLRVRDDGIGIAPENLSRVFEMFAQIETSLERSRDGLGIGLTLVKTLVEMHGWTIDVHSGGLGQGSEFVMRMPIVADTSASRSPSTATEARSGETRRVLIVDDNEDSAESLAMLLELEGHETHKAYDGIAALAAAERLRPDLVLLDIGLPGLNGYEVCSRLRREPWGKDMKLVALTGWGQDEDRQRSRDAGFDVHLVKPVDHKVLTNLLTSLPSGTKTSSD